MYLYILLLIIFLCSISNIEYFNEGIYSRIGISTRNTRGMSYDIRCLPHIQKKYIPWGYSTIYPNTYGKCVRLD